MDLEGSTAESAGTALLLVAVTHPAKRWWSLETTPTTVAYFGSVALLVVSLFRTRLLPLVDYPQHLAIAATLRRVWLGQAPAGAYETNLLGYNSLFHVVTALLGFAMPIELAGKLVLAGYLVVFAIALVALCDAVEVPRSRALLLVPLATGYTFAYGFANYGIALALQLIVLSRTLHAVSGRPEPRAWVTALIALAGMYAHVLGSAFAYLLLGVALVARRPAPKHALRAVAPLGPAVLYCAFVALISHGTARQNTEFIPLEGRTISLGAKLTRFVHFVTGLRADGIDELLVIAVAAVAVLGALARGDDRPPPFRIAMFAVTPIAYLALPHVFFATPFIFERAAALVILTLVLAVPSPRASLERVFRGGAIVLAVVSSLLFCDAMNSARSELADLDRVLDAAPEDRRLIGLVFDPHTPSFRLRAVLHAPAYYLARHRGELAWMFETVSLPVRPKRAEELRLPALFELNPTMYDPNAPYARYYDLVLVKSPRAELDPAGLVFRDGKPRRVIAQSGAWWLFEAR